MGKLESCSGWISESVYLETQKKLISKRVPECKALKKLGHLWSSFGQGLTIKELCIQLPTTISQYSSICYASTYPRILSHLLFRSNFFQSTRERQTHNSNPRCKNDVFHTKKTHSQPDFAAAALSSCHPVADQRRRPSCRIGPISQATKYSESHTFHSLFTDSETFCRSSALWDFCAASGGHFGEKQILCYDKMSCILFILCTTPIYIYIYLIFVAIQSQHEDIAWLQAPSKILSIQIDTCCHPIHLAWSDLTVLPKAALSSWRSEMEAICSWRCPLSSFICDRVSLKQKKHQEFGSVSVRTNRF